MWKFKDEEITRNIKRNITSIVEGTTEVVFNLRLIKNADF